MRGALHLLDPRLGGAFLALIADARPWARPSWQRAFGMDELRLARLRDAVAVALDGHTLTREELIAAVAHQAGLKELADGLRSGWGTLLKPLAWQGELCHGPSRGNRVTFRRPGDASSVWTGLPDMDAAPRIAVTAYLGAHGPSTPERFGKWLAGGFFGTRRLREWFADLGDAIERVDVEGQEAWALREHVPDLAAAKPASTVRLLPGFDQWVLGPGTDDGHVTPKARRGSVSRQAGWISPVVLAGGVVAGTWELRGSSAHVSWFDESGRLPERRLQAEVQRLGGLLGIPLQWEAEHQA
jgi:hypothetical protein